MRFGNLKSSKILILKTILVTALLSIHIAPTFAESQQPVRQLLQLSTKNQQLQALDEVIKMLAIQYAPLEYKLELYGKSLQELREKYSSMIETATTVDEFYGFLPKQERVSLTPEQARYVFVALISETHDGHAKILAPIRTFSGVGIRTVAVNGRLFVSALNKKVMKIVEQNVEAQPNDEIIEINGRDINYYKMRNLNYINNGTIEARKDEALERILEVPHALLPPLAKRNEPVVITFKRDDVIFKNTYRWREINATEMTRPLNPSEYNKRTERQRVDAPLVFGEKGNVRSYFFEGLLKLAQILNKEGQNKLSIIDMGGIVNRERSLQLAKFGSQMTTAMLSVKSNDELKKEDFEKMIRKITLSLGPVERIQAYSINGLSEKPIAVIRIPSYSPPGGVYEVINEISWIKSALEKFKSMGIETLIIDQLSNPGGYTVYGHLLLSLLAKPDQSLVALKAQLLLTESLYSHYLNDSSMLDENPDMTLRRRFLRKLRREMESGNRLSSPMPFSLEYDNILKDQYGVVENQPGSWDGKVVILADSRSASCGEIVPAILQDNKRALVFGERTMGLGFPLNGHVSGINFAEMDFRCPFAVCVRPNGESIENRGVNPDVVRNVTERDMKTRFVFFAVDAINATLGYAKEKSMIELQNQINTDLVKRKKIELSEEQKTTRDEIKKLRANLKTRINQLQGRTDFDSLEDWLEAYNTFFTELSRVEQAGQITPAMFEYILVPLPKFLTDMDVILKEATRKDVVLRRLEEMMNLPKVKSNTDLMTFIDEFRRRAMMVHGFYNFNLPCDKIFLKPAAAKPTSTSP